MRKERGKILVVLVAVMLILSCIPSGVAFAQGITPTPTITTPVYATDTSVSGTAVGNAGISLTVNGGTAQTTISNASGNWTVTGLTLATGDSISVTAQVGGATVSTAKATTVVVAPVQTPTPTITTPVYATNIIVSGTAVDNAGISLTVNGRTVQTTISNASGNWTVTGLTLAAGDSISVTAQVGGDTVSQAATATVQAAPVQTPTPTITTPVYTTNTSVSGMAIAGASIELTVNSGAAQAATADASGNWTVYGLTLADGDSISVTAKVGGATISQAATATVGAASAQTPTPTIATPIYAGSTTVSGTATAGAYIDLTVNSGAAQAATANSSGNWTVYGLTLADGDSISVTAQVTGDTVSAAATATVQAASAQTPTPTIATPIYSGSTSVSGTATAGASIELTVNSGAAQAATANASGNWTVSSLSALQTNDSISVTAQVTGDTVSAAATATVQAASAQTPTPTIATPIYAGATSVSGTATAGASIELTVNGGMAQAATANASGNWTVSSLSALQTNDSISVTAQVTGDTVSAAATATVKATPAAPVFSDVPATYWGYDAITNLSSRGIVSGYPDGTFEPDASITRAEFATMLAKALSLKTTGTTAQFTDVTADAWYYGAVNAAASAGLVSGTGDNLFAPNALITREQMAVMVTKALGNKAPAVNGTELNAFSDKSAVSSWAVTGMEEAVKADIVSGMTADTLAPLDNATRAQAAVMVYKLLTILG